MLGTGPFWPKPTWKQGSRGGKESLGGERKAGGEEMPMVATKGLSKPLLFLRDHILERETERGGGKEMEEKVVDRLPAGHHDCQNVKT